jgi:hypothetical protein
MKTKIRPGSYVEAKIPGPIRLRIMFEASAEIDIALLSPSQHEAFGNSDDGIEAIPNPQYFEEATASADFVLDIPEGDNWLVLVNAYEDKPVKLTYDSATRIVFGDSVNGGGTLESETTEKDLFLVLDNVRIAKRGHYGTPQAKTWVPLLPGWEVRDIEGGEQIEVIKNGQLIPIGPASTKIH